MRWAATPGGNLALLRHPDYYLESDFATVLAGAGGRVEVSSGSKSRCGFLWHSCLAARTECAGFGQLPESALCEWIGFSEMDAAQRGEQSDFGESLRDENESMLKPEGINCQFVDGEKAQLFPHGHNSAHNWI